MRIFTGQYERSIDAKNRIQLPSQIRSAIYPDTDGRGLYITLGEHRGTLSIFTHRAFDTLAERMETEFLPGCAVTSTVATTSLWKTSQIVTFTS